MSFVNAWPIWTGLAALGLAVPVLIHLWSRNQKFETKWAAMELLKKAMIARSRKIQIEDYILMLLRALALLLIAVALLRPIFNTGGAGGAQGWNTTQPSKTVKMQHAKRSARERDIPVVHPRHDHPAQAHGRG